MDTIELISDLDFNSLLKTFEKIMLELADRLVKPNAGVMFGKGGVPDAECLKRLGNLGLAIQQRNILMSKGLADVLYNTPADLETATKTINGIWTTMKTSAIDKGVAIDSAVPLNAATYGTTNATLKKDMRLIFLINTLEGIKALTNAAECTRHLRLGHFATNVIGGKKGTLGLEAFKAAATQWIKDYPKEEDVTHETKKAIATHVLGVTERAPPPPGIEGWNARMERNKVALEYAARGEDVPGQYETGAGAADDFTRRLAELRRGGYRKRSGRKRSGRKCSGRKRSGRGRKTKRRHH